MKERPCCVLLVLSIPIPAQLMGLMIPNRWLPNRGQSETRSFESMFVCLYVLASDAVQSQESHAQNIMHGRSPALPEFTVIDAGRLQI